MVGISQTHDGVLLMEFSEAFEIGFDRTSTLFKKAIRHISPMGR